MPDAVAGGTSTRLPAFDCGNLGRGTTCSSFDDKDSCTFVLGGNIADVLDGFRGTRFGFVIAVPLFAVTRVFLTFMTGTEEPLELMDELGRTICEVPGRVARSLGPLSGNPVPLEFETVGIPEIVEPLLEAMLNRLEDCAVGWE